MEHFTCTHCGHHFETQETETIVCPNCFWSTSVKKEESRGPVVKPVEVQTVKGAAPQQEDSPQLWLGVGGVLFVLLLVGIFVFAVRHLKKQDEILHKIESKNAQVIAAEAPELALSNEEKEILHRTIPIEVSAALTDADKKILAPKFILRSTLTQGIPTPPWDEKQFEEFLKGVQQQYRIPLGGSYRRKLTQLFREHYLPAAQAFEAKDFLKARDEWIRSLAFPIYQNDVKKHRGVILTMLRPYVNDILSKIGAINTSLTGGELGAQESKIRMTYQNLQDLLQKESWEEANAVVLELSRQLEEIEKVPKTATPPPLPKEISAVDPDIQDVLLAQAAPIQQSLPDPESLRQDLAAKEKVIQNHLAGAIDLVRKQYETALLLIRNKNWSEARDELQKISFPPALVEDAEAKIKIINQIASPSIDSKEETG